MSDNRMLLELLLVDRLRHPARWLCAICLGGWMSSHFLGADVTLGDEAAGVLRLKHGQFAVGHLAGSPAEDQLAWQAEGLDGLLRVGGDDIQRLDTGHPLQVLEDGLFAFELDGGDCLLGRPQRMVDGKIEVSSPAMGRVLLEPHQILQIRRIHVPGEALMEGLSRELDPEKHQGWRFEGSSWRTGKLEAIWVEPFVMPLRCRVDLRLSWEGTPNFEVVFGAREDQKVPAGSPRLEVWDRGLVAVQQTALQTDLVQLIELHAAEQELALSCYLDWSLLKMTVFTSTGAFLGQIGIEKDDDGLRQGMTLVNHGDHLAVDALRLFDWEGNLPVARRLAEGEASSELGQIAGRLISFDGERQFFLVEANDGGRREVGLSELEAFIHLGAGGNAEKVIEPNSLRQVVQTQLVDGGYLRGRLTPAPQGFLALTNLDGDRSFQLPLSAIFSLRRPQVANTEADTFVFPPWQLSTEGVNLYGRLTEQQAAKSSIKFGFQPAASTTAVGIPESTRGTLVSLRGNSPAAKTAPRNPVVAEHLAMFPEHREGEQNNAALSPYRAPRDLRLRSGDVLEATIEKIDAQGVHFTSTATATRFLPHDAIRSAQLQTVAYQQSVDPKKMARLLTVPRFQKDRPPTHLILTTGGDFIRGRLLELSDEKLMLEQGETSLSLPRSLVSVVIWLFDRGWEEQRAPVASGEPGEQFLVHARSRTQDFYTFELVRHDASQLVGRSALLGDVELAIDSLDSLHFGRNLPQLLDELEANPWRLSLAKLPQVFETPLPGAKDEQLLGQVSELIGKPAPNFELKDLQGKPWRLSNAKEQIVVLDFWASWCGPCMATMPQVEGIVRDLLREDVLWLGINIEETPLRARSAIDRLKIESPILLDEFGGVAAEYQAEAIPFTVIIDRQGIIRYAFRGSEPETVLGIHQALKTLLEAAEGN
jgi:thiol-disulfide isomerase/thioredoxin